MLDEAQQRFVDCITARIEEVTTQGVHPHLKPYLTPEELLFCLKAIRQRMLDVDYEHLMRLEPGEVVAFKKTDLLTSGKGVFYLPELSRSSAVIRDEQGEYQLVIDTKSKLAGGVAGTPNLFFGKDSKGKDCWNVTNPVPERWANLVYPIPTLRAEKDLNITQKNSDFLAHPNIHRTFLGHLYQKRPIRPFETPINNPEKKRSLYSKKAIGDLQQVLEAREKQRKPLSVAEKNDIAWSFLEGLAHIHRKNRVHEDIKPENLLIYEQNERYYTKINDFMTCRTIGIGICAVYTIGYESPEVFWMNQHMDTHIGHALKAYDTSYGRRCAKKINLSDVLQLDKTLQNSHPVHDCWAAGITLMTLYTDIASECQAVTVEMLLENLDDALWGDTPDDIKRVIANFLNPDIHVRLRLLAEDAVTMHVQPKSQVCLTV